MPDESADHTAAHDPDPAALNETVDEPVPDAAHARGRRDRSRSPPVSRNRLAGSCDAGSGPQCPAQVQTTDPPHSVAQLPGISPKFLSVTPAMTTTNQAFIKVYRQDAANWPQPGNRGRRAAVGACSAHRWRSWPLPQITARVQRIGAPTVTANLPRRSTCFLRRCSRRWRRLSCLRPAGGKGGPAAAHSNCFAKTMRAGKPNGRSRRTWRGSNRSSPPRHKRKPSLSAPARRSHHSAGRPSAVLSTRSCGGVGRRRRPVARRDRVGALHVWSDEPISEWWRHDGGILSRRKIGRPRSRAVLVEGSFYTPRLANGSMWCQRPVGKKCSRTLRRLPTLWSIPSTSDSMFCC